VLITAIGTIGAAVAPRAAQAEPKAKKKPAPPIEDPVHRVLVLPVDGNASAVLRAKLGESIKRLARSLDGSVTDGESTFAEAALAVGCDPQVPACADQVLTTLAVDELVFATATTTTPATASASQGAGTTRVVVHRIGKGVPAREASTALTSSDPPERVEPALQSLFPAAVVAPSTPEIPSPGTVATGTTSSPALRSSTTSSVPAGMDARGEGRASDRDDLRDRNLGIACATGGGVLVAIGLILWLDESSIQGDIDRHATITSADFAELTSLESDASSRATLGNVMVVTGLVAGGIGGYLLWRWHDSSVSVAPRPIDHGAAVSIGARW